MTSGTATIRKKMNKLNPNPKYLRDDWMFDSREKKLLKIKKFENNNLILNKLIAKNNQRIIEIKNQIKKSDQQKIKKRFILT